MDSSIVGLHQCRDMSFPVSLLMFFDSSQHVEKGLIKSFYHAVSHQVVRGGACLLYSGHVTEFPDEFRLEVGSLVAV